MKKVLIGILQFVSFYVLYNLILYIYNHVLNTAYDFVLRIPIINIFFLRTCVYDFLFYTLLPAATGFTIVLIMYYMFKKTGIYLGSAIAIMVFLCSTVVNYLLNAISLYGIFSMMMARTIWFSVIFYFILIVGIYGSTNYTLSLKSKKEDSEISNEIARS